MIDGAKALRAGIDAVYGKDNPVQRCRKHKERNVEGHLPREMGEYARATMRAAWKLPADEGTMRIKTFAESIARQYPDAAASLVEAEKNFRRVMGYRDLWMLESALREGVDNSEKAA